LPNFQEQPIQIQHGSDTIHHAAARHAAPDFQLPDTNGKTVSLGRFQKRVRAVVIFMCNHCPYVIHIRAGLAQLARDYAPKNVAIVGINSNDAKNYPDDSPAKMKTK
jgi:peroxiredoxin